MKKKIIYMMICICTISYFTSAGNSNSENFHFPCCQKTINEGKPVPVKKETKEKESFELSPFNYILFTN